MGFLSVGWLTFLKVDDRMDAKITTLSDIYKHIDHKT